MPPCNTVTRSFGRSGVRSFGRRTLTHFVFGYLENTSKEVSAPRQCPLGVGGKLPLRYFMLTFARSDELVLSLTFGGTSLRDLHGSMLGHASQAQTSSPFWELVGTITHSSKTGR